MQGLASLAALCATILLLAALASPGRSAETPPPFAAPTKPRAHAAFRMLETHCARCHQAGQLKRPRAAADLANILSLEEIAADPHLVKPGNPDASRLYLKVLGREMPYDVFQEAGNGERPTPAEITALRVWIANLPRRRAPICASPTARLAETEAALAMAADLAEAGPKVAGDYRYLTISHLAPACGGEKRLAALRAGVEALVNAWNRTAKVARLTAVDPASTILRLRLSEIGWPAEAWEAIASASPYRGGLAGATFEPVRAATRSAVPAIRADWLAFLLSEETVARLPALTSARDVSASIAKMQSPSSDLQRLAATAEDRFLDLLAVAGIDTRAIVDGLPPAHALARLYRKDVTVDAAAAELGTDPSELVRGIAGATPETAFLLRRLQQSGLRRGEFELVYDQLKLAREADPNAAPVGLGIVEALKPEDRRPFALELAVDKSQASTREVVRLTLRSERECHLTIIGVDSGGNALVLLPNDFDRDTRLPKDRLMQFPRPGAPFRFRLGKPGYETFVAACNPNGPGVDGVRQDFNLQKFTDLGPYEAYLERWLAGETVEAKPVRRRPVPRRRGRDRTPEPAVAQNKVPQAPIERRAVQVEVR
jgi:hypothetical protein